MWGAKASLLLAVLVFHGHYHPHARIDWAHVEENRVEIQAIERAERRGE